MKQFKFNEQAAIEKMISSNFVDKNNIVNTIYSLAKYNYHVMRLSDKANYNHILKYITSNCEHIFEESIYQDIENCIKNAKKHTLATIDKVCITQNEINTIKELGDIKQEKALFVLLAISKYFNLLNGKNYDAAFLTNADICKMARITIPTCERDQFMQFLYEKELLFKHTWCDSTIKKLTFVSHDDNDKVVLKLGEGDFKDLAYTYLAYVSPSKFRRCVNCGRWMRVNKKDIRLCTECCNASNIVEDKDAFKTVVCEDCGKVIYVSVLNTKTCRCEECQEQYRKEYMRDLMREKRVSTASKT